MDSLQLIYLKVTVTQDPFGTLRLPVRGRRVLLSECFGSLLDPFGSLGTPAGSRRSPGNSHIVFCFNFSPIFEPGLIPRWVRKRLFSDVSCRTAAARAARVIRRTRQARNEGDVEAQSGFGVVNNRSNSLSSLFATKRAQRQLWTLPGSFF